ncbi:MAG TPA: FlgD immunoglobulin-like domain containing protein [Steroidobacteraceae bacterium]|nr:FlgD immunoglobulin-like domain containing protein [Steroidobacteraceae bacterium]
MSSTTPVNSATASAASNSIANAVPANMQISESGFLKLITAQLQDQNPLQPADPTQFLSQLEGMSEVSSLQSVQQSITGLAGSLQGQQVLNGTSLLGHSVLVPGSVGALSAGGSIGGAVAAPAGATSLIVSIADASGALVNSFAVAPQASGLTNFSWNGTNSSGQAMPAGQYAIKVTANVNGTNQSVSPLVAAQVQSVTLDPSTQSLDLNTDAGTVPLSAVVSVL